MAGSAVIKGDFLAKPNYQFEKRQRDLAKKNKQEEKRQRKLAEKTAEDACAPGAVEATTDATPPSTAGAAGVVPAGETLPET